MQIKLLSWSYCSAIQSRLGALLYGINYLLSLIPQRQQRPISIAALQNSQMTQRSKSTTHALNSQSSSFVCLVPEQPDFSQVHRGNQHICCLHEWLCPTAPHQPRDLKPWGPEHEAAAYSGTCCKLVLTAPRSPEYSATRVHRSQVCRCQRELRCCINLFCHKTRKVKNQTTNGNAPESLFEVDKTGADFILCRVALRESQIWDYMSQF